MTCKLIIDFLLTDIHDENDDMLYAMYTGLFYIIRLSKILITCINHWLIIGYYYFEKLLSKNVIGMHTGIRKISKIIKADVFI